MTDIPVLFVAFNRPELTRQSFQAIRVVRPRRLFVALDGPRDDTDLGPLSEVRTVVEDVDWPCKVEYRQLGENAGCGRAVSGAISWFFDAVEAGIVIEDDIVITRAFIDFCEKNLVRFKEDRRVWSVAGSNQLGRWASWSQDLLHAAVTPVWGWATWRDRWVDYEFDLGPSWTTPANRAVVADWLGPAWARLERAFELVHEGDIDTWDFQLTFAQALHRATCVIPTTNLVRNIGFGAGATHTQEPSALYKTWTGRARGRTTPNGGPDRAYQRALEWRTQHDGRLGSLRFAVEVWDLLRPSAYVQRADRGRS